MAETTLSTRTLNRALLDRQMLLERSDQPLTRVIEQMGGIQTQYAPAGYIGLWSRMRDFERPMLTAALEDRRAIQATMMRVTIHTVSAADYWPMLAGILPATRAWLARVHRSELGGVDLDAVAADVRNELADGPLRMRELVSRMEGRGHPARAVAWATQLIELVRVPPSGTWERRRADIYGLAEQWLPRVEVIENEGIQHLVRRYLGAFGPSSLRDIATWMGLKVGAVRPVAERMDLRPYRDLDGRPLLDLPDATLPDPETPAPARFLAVWDALLLVHARRTEVLPEDLRPLIFNTKTPHSVNTVLVDGQVAATWRHAEERIHVEPLRRMNADEQREIEAEADGLAALHAD